MITPPKDRPSAGILFTKASACGNDFLLVDGVDASADLAELTYRMCDRHYGIGADGVEWLFPDAEADINARLINADGSEAEISGNGTRCVAAEIYSRTGKMEIAIRTGAGLKICRFISRQGNTFEFEADMGQPEVGDELSIAFKEGRAKGTKVSMGNPHFVIFVDSFQDGWQRAAASIGALPQFPQGTNVEYVAVRSRNEIEFRIFERGAGETQSSGTGSCASAVAAIASGRVASPVTVIAPGGPQTVRWEDQVYLRGPATLICRGEFFV
ncbi:MAG TPA: diaminopimelate epimerase [Terriglobales bacterium]|jgi:diaminopimelate epimerase|nr:diaminopimelate epimerase [Terriglobales bacterium]